MAWHWEEKNYTSWVSNKIKELLKDFRVDDKQNGIEIELLNPDIQGDASISLRRGKATTALCITLNLDWVGHVQTDFVSGKISILEFDQDSLHEDPEIVITLSSSVPSKKVDILQAFIKNNVKKSLLDLLRHHILMTMKTVEMERLLRNQQIIEDKKQEQQLFNITNHEHESTVSSASSETVSCCVEEQTKPFIEKHKLNELCVQNTTISKNNNFFWEEKLLNASTTEALKNLLTSIGNEKKIRLLEHKQCILELFDVYVSGEASSNIRKSNKTFVLFEYIIRFSWKAVNRKQDGTFLADVKGSGEVFNFTSEDLEDLSIVLKCDDVHHPARKYLFDVVREEGTMELKKILLTFAEMLQTSSCCQSNM